MPLTLTTFAANAVISAPLIRDRLSKIQRYIDEEVVATDRGTAWMNANHVFRPDPTFGHTTLVSGESYFATRGQTDAERSFFSYQLNTGSFISVPGMSVPLEIVESFAQGTYRYRLQIFASFYAYEFGGADVASIMNEDTDKAATFALGIDATTFGQTNRDVYKGSDTSASQLVATYPRKQITMFWAENDTTYLAPGVHHAGVRVGNYVPGGGQSWKHVVLRQGSLVARYFDR